MIGFLVFSLLSPLGLMAQMESAQVLPQGVYSPQVSFGVAEGLGERFNSSGRVVPVTQKYQFDLTGRNLSRVNSNAKRLISALNEFTSQQALGDRYYGGRLNFEASPSIQYMIPMLAYGVTGNFSIGFGIPIIHFRNTVNVKVEGQSNHDEIQSLAKGASSQVDEGMVTLKKAVDEIPQTINSTLEAQGYRPLRPVEFTALGDLIIAGVYRYYNRDGLILAVKPWVQLPTGRADDPDDVVDTAVGNQPAIGVKSVHDYRLSSRITLHQSVGVAYNVPDAVEMRVPRDRDDILPGPESKERVNRKTGDSLIGELGATAKIFQMKSAQSVSLSPFYSYEVKGRDTYTGDRDRDYGVLGEDTQGSVHRLYVVLEFSTVEAYLAKSVQVPFNVGYVYGNTLGGENTRQQITHHMYLRMFF